MKPEECNHKGRVDLTQGLGPDRHFYCKACGSHWYKGLEWNRAKWEEYVNDV